MKFLGKLGKVGFKRRGFYLKIDGATSGQWFNCADHAPSKTTAEGLYKTLKDYEEESKKTKKDIRLEVEGNKEQTNYYVFKITRIEDKRTTEEKDKEFKEVIEEQLPTKEPEKKIEPLVETKIEPPVETKTIEEPKKQDVKFAYPTEYQKALLPEVVKILAKQEKNKNIATIASGTLSGLVGILDKTNIEEIVGKVVKTVKKIVETEL